MGHLAVCRELLEMTLHEGAVDLHQGFLAGKLHCQGHEEPLQTWIDNE